jgi:hypothetical protein
MGEISALAPTNILVALSERGIFSQEKRQEDFRGSKKAPTAFP